MIISGRGATTLVVALCISVFLNLIAAGFIGAIGGGAIVAGIAMRQTAGPVPQPLRQAFREEMRANRRSLIAALGDLRRDRDRLHDALTAEPFNRAAVETVNAALRKDVDEIVTIGQGVLVDAVAKLPADVRKDIPRLTLGEQLLRSLNDPDRTEPTDQ